MDARLLRLQHPENVRAFPSESVLMPDSTQIRDAIPDRLSPPPLMTAVSTPLWTVPLADVLVSDDEIDDVSAVYRSGWLTQGPLTRAFEEAIEAYTGAPHAIAVSNCTAALHLIAAAVGLGPGDEVIMPALTFVATANSVAYTGAKPVFADIVSLTE